MNLYLTSNFEVRKKKKLRIIILKISFNHYDNEMVTIVIWAQNIVNQKLIKFDINIKIHNLFNNQNKKIVKMNIA